MAFDEDHAAFFDVTNGFAITAVYNGSIDVVGIFDSDFIAPFSTGVEGTQTIFTAPTSSIPTPAHGDTLKIGGTTYTIEGIEPDGAGITQLRLAEQ